MNSTEEMTLEEKLKCSLSYDPDTGLIYWRHRMKGRRAFCTKDKHGYLVGRAFGPKLKAHRVVWFLHYNEWPNGELDHINGDKADNRVANLRDVDRSTNMRNTKISSTNSTGHTGVHYHKANKKYIAYIRHEGRLNYLGSFLSLDQAVEARQKANLSFGYHPNHGRR
jgi:hypothetical protein